MKEKIQALVNTCLPKLKSLYNLLNEQQGRTLDGLRRHYLCYTALSEEIVNFTEQLKQIGVNGDDRTTIYFLDMKVTINNESYRVV